MPTEGSFSFYHSFPRFLAGHSVEDEIKYGKQTLLSILEHGLLLIPETISYPFVEEGTIDFNKGTDVYQRRLCFTFMRRTELLYHAALFGMFTIEFDIKSIRKMGAIPVIYIPQPIQQQEYTVGFDVLGNNLVHQIRDTAVLLEEILNLQELLEEARNRGSTKIDIETRGEICTIDIRTLSFIHSYLLGNKGSFSTLLAYVNSLSNFFYHTDSARLQTYIRSVDFHYYHQREWRIISGMKIDNYQFDRELTPAESRFLMNIDNFFCEFIKLKDGSSVPRISEARIVSQVSGNPLWMHIECLHVPDVVASEIRDEIKRRSISIPIQEVACEEILTIRRQLLEKN